MKSKKTTYNILSSLLLQVIIIVYGFIVPKLIIVSFGSKVNGLITSITQFLAYITLLESGIGPVVKAALYKPIVKKDKQTIINILNSAQKFFRTISYIFIVYIIVLCFVYPLIVNKDFSNLFSISLIIIISISTFAEYYFGIIYKLFLQADQKNYVISIIQIVTYILNIILFVFMIKINLSIHIIKLVSSLTFVLRPIFLNYYAKKHYNINLKEADSNFKLKNKWDGLAQHIAAIIHGNTDIVILTLFSSLVNVSIYSVYSLIVRGIRSIVIAFTSGIEESFGNMYASGEKEQLDKQFSVFEVLYFMVTVIACSSAIVLIIPFVRVYTLNFDGNYILPTFAYLLLISEYVCMIRVPYIDLTYSVGHFKETRIGAWVECLSNIVISIILVKKYGLIGVAIGTLVAMFIRTCEFLYHANKYILERNIWISIKKILVVILETLIIILLFNVIELKFDNSYFNWIINAIIVFMVSTLVVVIINYIAYPNYFKYLLNYLKKRLLFMGRKK